MRRPYERKDESWMKRTFIGSSPPRAHAASLPAATFAIIHLFTTHSRHPQRSATRSRQSIRCAASEVRRDWTETRPWHDTTVDAAFRSRAPYTLVHRHSGAGARNLRRRKLRAAG